MLTGVGQPGVPSGAWTSPVIVATQTPSSPPARVRRPADPSTAGVGGPTRTVASRSRSRRRSRAPRRQRRCPGPAPRAARPVRSRPLRRRLPRSRTATAWSSTERTQTTSPSASIWEGETGSVTESTTEPDAGSTSRSPGPVRSPTGSRAGSWTQRHTSEAITVTMTAATMARFRRRRLADMGSMAGPVSVRIRRGGRPRIGEQVLTQRGHRRRRVQAELLAESTSVAVESAQGVVDAADLPQGAGEQQDPVLAERLAPDGCSKLRQHLGRPALVEPAGPDPVLQQVARRVDADLPGLGESDLHDRPAAAGLSPRGPRPTPTGRPSRPRPTAGGRRRPRVRSRGGSRRGGWRSVVRPARPRRDAVRRRRCGPELVPTTAGRRPRVRRSRRRSGRHAPHPMPAGRGARTACLVAAAGCAIRRSRRPHRTARRRHPRPPLVHRPSSRQHGYSRSGGRGEGAFRSV